VKSDQLDMQALQTKWKNGKATVNTKFAIRYGKTAYVLVINKENELEATMVSPTKDDDELEVIQTDRKGKSMEFVLGDGTGKVVVTKGGSHINIVITISPGLYPQATGLCYGLDKGDTQIPKDEDMFKGNCKIPAAKFQKNLRKCLMVPACEEYVVIPTPVVVVLPAEETLPADNTTVLTNTTIPEPPYVPTVPMPKPPLKPGCVRITVHNKYEPTKVYNNVTEKTYPAVAPEVCAQRCDALLKDYKITTVDRDFYVKSCAFDYENSGDVATVETYRKTYNAECGTVVDYKSQSLVEEDRVNAKEVAKEYGIGPEAVCDEDLCGNGYCAGSTCACNEGYLGDKCEYTENEPEAIQASSSVKIAAYSLAAIFVFALAA
jgi:hypothetical protein